MLRLFKKLLGLNRPLSVDEAKCNFCGLTARDQGPLVEGLRGVLICGSCAEFARDLVAEELERQKQPAPPASNANPYVPPQGEV